MKRAYLLAGGRSQRFGVDKARVLIDRIPQISRLASGLNQNGWRVAIVAQSISDYEDLGLEVITDLQPHAGPLAGLIAALTDCEARGEADCLISNVDLIVSDWDWLEAMQRVMSQTKPSVVVFRSAEFIPLPGWYSVGALETARSLWDNGKRSLRDLHESLERTIATLDWPIGKIPRSFNTPEELREILGRSPGA